MQDMSEELFQDIGLEQILLYHIVNSANGTQKSLISRTRRPIFTHTDNLEIFDVVREISSQNKPVSNFSVSNRLTEKYGRPRNSLTNMLSESFVAVASTVNAEDALVELKSLLYKRIASARILRIKDNIKSGVPINIEINKLLIAEASLLDKKINTLEELAKMTSERINSNDDVIVTGFKFLNQRTGGLTRRSISGLLARPSHCKSTLSGALMYDTLRTTNNTGLFISLEDSSEEIIKRMVAQDHRKSLVDMRFKKVTVDYGEVLHTLKNTLGGRFHVVDTRNVLTPEDAVSVIADVKPTLVVVDYLQKFKMDDMVQGCIKAIQALDVAASRHNCHILICSQVPDKKVSFREDPFPTASDTMWTSSLYQAASEMFSMYYQYSDTKNEFQRGTLQLRILKAKFSGALGDVILNVETGFGRVIGESLNE